MIRDPTAVRAHLAAEGMLNNAGVFEVREVLAKHDETYMPPEVAEASDPLDCRWRRRIKDSVTTPW